MNFMIDEGAKITAQKVVIYGPEGIGKTTLASKFPDPVYIDTENSTSGYVVRRISAPGGGDPRPTSFTMLEGMVEAVRDGQIPCKTLVIDSLDWAETLCIQHVCAKKQVTGIEDFGYGKGYVYLEERFGKFLNLLSEVTARGIHVVCTAHAQLRKIELPEETGAYDHWELKLEKKTAALVKEWADMVLFLNYKTIVNKAANPMEKNKAAGGKRMMYTTHTPWWDAKNRLGLPESTDMSYDIIAPYMDLVSGKPAPATAVTPQKAAEHAPVSDTAPVEKPAAAAPAAQEPKKEPAPDPRVFDDHGIPPGFYEQVEEVPPPAGVPKKLWQLMQADGVTVEQIQIVVAEKGYYPLATPIGKYDPKFIDGVLIGAWNQVKSCIKK